MNGQLANPGELVSPVHDYSFAISSPHLRVSPSNIWYISDFKHDNNYLPGEQLLVISAEALPPGDHTQTVLVISENFVGWVYHETYTLKEYIEKFGD